MVHLLRLLAIYLGGALCGTAAEYFVSNAGDDTGAGTTEATAWRTLARVSSASLLPGDRIRLRSGDRFSGTLLLAAQGAAGREIVVERYGEGARPCIDGGGAEAAIRLVNPAHLVVRGLELINEDGRYGVWLTGQDAGPLGRVTLEDLEIHRIYRAAWSRPADDGHGPYKYHGGINAQILRGARPTQWEALIIRGNTFHDLGTCGLSIGSAYPLHAQRRRGGEQPHPILGVLVEGNLFRDIARDGAILRQCRGAIIQHNDVIRAGRVSMANGLWFWDCEASVIRRNRGTGCGVRGLADGSPFSIDYNCADCVVEENFSHDNEGPGWMAFGNGRTGRGSVFRGNVSWHDATAPAKPGFAAVTMVSTLAATLVEGNVVIAGPQTRVLLGHHDWQGLPEEIHYRGNIFVGNDRALVEAGVAPAGRFDGNYFVRVPALPDGVGPPPADASQVISEALARCARVAAKAGIQGLRR